MQLVAAILAIPLALGLIAAGWHDTPPPASIPLASAGRATPVRWPETPPILRTPLFISTDGTPYPYVTHHANLLMRWYIPSEPTPHLEMR
jgi:hypothetical protein